MTADPTKNLLPWRVRKAFGEWHVFDASGIGFVSFCCATYGEEKAHMLARMVAAGSVAADLYAALIETVYRPEDETTERKVMNAIAFAAPLLEPKPENT